MSLNDAPYIPGSWRKARIPFKGLNGFIAGRWLTGIASVVAVLVALPLLTILASLFLDGDGTWPHIRDTLLAPMLINTVLLGLGTGVGVVLIGVSTAWLVTMCSFPGRRIFEWALILPLAIPAYVFAYVYTDFLHHPGLVQSTLRAITGWGPRDYWFPEIRSLEGAIILFTAAFYPYVYLLARTAFLQQSSQMIEASRSLGCTPWSSFWRVSLPLARPAIVAGTALALMETLADFGAVAHFGVQTFTTGIYRVWFSFGDSVLAAQLASALLTFVLILLFFERRARGRTRFDDSRQRFRALKRYRLSGWQAGGAFAVCAVPLTVGFLLPVALLIWLTITAGHDLFGVRYIRLALNSVTLAGIASVATVLTALVIAYSVRFFPGRLTNGISRLAGAGYAIPGTVIAVGILIPLTAFDTAVDGVMRSAFNTPTGLILTGTITALIYAYIVRFLSISLQSVDAGLQRITPRMDAAARTLGAGPAETLRRVHAPILSGGLLTAGLIVFVDVVKELPATLILRPFNFDTLAIQAYRLASDERLAEASTASLAIVAAGLIPVLLLSRSIARSRPGR